MNKLFISILSVILFCSAAEAGQVRVNREISGLVQKLSATYKKDKDIVIKKNISVAAFEAQGEAALKNGLGRTLQDLLSTEVSRSTVFNLVERADMAQVLKEQALQLSGVTDSAKAVETGKILNADVLLFGSVSEAGDNFVITAKLVDVETSQTISENVTVPKTELIKTADALLDMAYVKKNGVGISMNILGATLSGNNSAFTQAPAETETGFFHRAGVEVKYRAANWLMFGIGINMLWGQVYNYPNQAWEASAGGDPIPVAGSGNLIVTAKGSGIPINVYLNYNLTRKLNIFASGGVEFSMLNLDGYFPESVPNGGGAGFGMNQHLGPTFYAEPILGNVMAGLEYFVSPRLAVSAKAGYRFGTTNIDYVGVSHLTGLPGTTQEIDFGGFSFLQTVSVYF